MSACGTIYMVCFSPASLSPGFVYIKSESIHPFSDSKIDCIGSITHK